MPVIGGVDGFPDNEPRIGAVITIGPPSTDGRVARQRPDHEIARPTVRQASFDHHVGAECTNERQMAPVGREGETRVVVAVAGQANHPAVDRHDPNVGLAVGALVTVISIGSERQHATVGAPCQIAGAQVELSDHTQFLAGVFVG